MFGLLAIVTCFYCCLRTGCCRLVWFGVVVAADLFSVALWRLVFILVRVGLFAIGSCFLWVCIYCVRLICVFGFGVLNLYCCMLIWLLLGWVVCGCSFMYCV